eukprot:snap_masked-scaffold_48-processed-gene-1.122-mRNA-1 protein AED:1.00 eAED:1.00 QI:0/-1/0/0/-1/1/1/0/336
MKTKRKRGVLVLGPEEGGRTQFVDALKETEKAPDATQGNEPSNGEQTPLGNGVIINPQQYLELSEKEFHRKILNYCSKYDIVSVVCVIGYGEIDTRQSRELLDIINLLKKRFTNIAKLIRYVFNDQYNHFSEESIRELIKNNKEKYNTVLLDKSNVVILNKNDFSALLEYTIEKIVNDSSEVLNSEQYSEKCNSCGLLGDPVLITQACYFHEGDAIAQHLNLKPFHPEATPTWFHPGTLRKKRSSNCILEILLSLIGMCFGRRRVYSCCKGAPDSVGCEEVFSCCKNNSDGCQKKCLRCGKSEEEKGCTEVCVLCTKEYIEKGCIESVEHKFVQVV